MHVRGDFTAYDTECARLAVSFAAASLDLQPETLCRGDFTAYDTECACLAVSFAAASLDLQPETLCRRVYTEIERRIFLGVS